MLCAADFEDNTLSNTPQDPTPPQLVHHEDISIKFPPTTRPLPKSTQIDPHLTVCFDGGTAKKQGTGGYAVFRPDEGCVRA